MVMSITRVQYVLRSFISFKMYLKSNYIEIWTTKETETKMRNNIRYERVPYNKLLWTWTVCCNIRKSTFKIFVLLSFWEEKWWNEWRIEKPLKYNEKKYKRTNERTNEFFSRALRGNIKLSKSRQKIIAFRDTTTITSLVVY